MRNAKQILQASLKDINDGRWVCGELCSLPSGHQGETVTKKDMMGCALGLVSIWGDDTETGSIEIQGVENPNYNAEAAAWYNNPSPNLLPFPSEYLVLPRYITTEVARYADVNSPKAVIKAIKALYAATPKNYQQRNNPSLDVSGNEVEFLDTLNVAVYNYNDSLRGMFKTSKGQTNAARRWFEKAILTLPGVDASLKAPGMLDTTKSESLVTIL